MSNISVSFDCGKQRDTGRAWIKIPAPTIAKPPPERLFSYLRNFAEVSKL